MCSSFSFSFWGLWLAWEFSPHPMIIKHYLFSLLFYSFLRIRYFVSSGIYFYIWNVVRIRLFPPYEYPTSLPPLSYYHLTEHATPIIYYYTHTHARASSGLYSLPLIAPPTCMLTVPCFNYLYTMF